VFSLLPVDQRMRCAEVCRGWRATLRDHSLWTRLDLSKESTRRFATPALLRAATLRAGGQLSSLDLTGAFVQGWHTALLAVMTANAGTLREVRIFDPECPWHQACVTLEQLAALLQAAPQLQLLRVDVACSFAEARRVLRNEPPFAAVRVNELHVSAEYDTALDAADVLMLPEDMVTHASLVRLSLNNIPLDVLAALDAVVDAALARRLTAVTFFDCSLSPESAPALARLLGGSALRKLEFWSLAEPLFDAPAAALLSAALQANSTLTSLVMRNVEFWHDADAAMALIQALTGHASLRIIDVSNNDGAAQAAAAGAALGALVAANAPALHEVHVDDCELGNVGLGPLVDALPLNTHLRELNLSRNDFTEGFVRNQLAEAVNGNTSLRKLVLFARGDSPLALEELVRGRIDADDD
jgi:hypothetical protein